jgi:hypothetical protein
VLHEYVLFVTATTSETLMSDVDRVAVTPISDGLARAEVRYGFMERPEHSGGAGGGGGEALGAALDRDEALPHRSPVGRFLPVVASHR